MCQKSACKSRAAEGRTCPVRQNLVTMSFHHVKPLPKRNTTQTKFRPLTQRKRWWPVGGDGAHQTITCCLAVQQRSPNSTVGTVTRPRTGPRRLPSTARNTSLHRTERLWPYSMGAEVIFEEEKQQRHTANRCPVMPKFGIQGAIPPF